MDPFDDCIGLGINGCNSFTFEAIVFLTHLGKFSDKFGTTIKHNHKFGTTIKHNFLWKWLTSKIIFLSNICNFYSYFIGYLFHLKPAYGRINYREAPQFKRVFPF